MTVEESVTYKAVFSRWFPLALSWALMSLELPLVQAIISDLPESSHNLAALGITFAICLLCESPILMLVSAGAALVKDDQSFRKLRMFSLSLSLLMSLVFGIASLALYHSGVLYRISNYDSLLADRVFDACLISLIIPFAVGNRRFIQGVLIRSGKSFLLTIGTVTRLILIISVGLLLSQNTSWQGAVVGSWAAVAGIVGESIMITLLSVKARKELKNSGAEATPLSYLGISKFYSPLAISGVVNLSVLPVLTFFMSQSIEPVNSLAGYQVLQGMIFFLSALALGLQEVVVSMLGSQHQGYRVLRNFTFALSVTVGSFFALYILSPLSAIVLTKLVGIPPELEQFLHPALILALPIPFSTVLIVAMRGVVVVARRTRWITAASLAELVSVALVMHAMQEWGAYPGLINAVCSLLVARVLAFLVLANIFTKLRSDIHNANKICT